MKIHSAVLEYNRYKPSNQFVFIHKAESEDFTYDSSTENYIKKEWLYQTVIPYKITLETLSNDSYRVIIGFENELSKEEINELKIKMIKIILSQIEGELESIQNLYNNDIDNVLSFLSTISRNKKI